MTAAADPATLADVQDLGVYRLAVAARLLGVHPETLLRHGVRTLPRPFANSAHRVLGGEILRLAGLHAEQRAARTSERGETQAEREKRAAEAVAAAKAHLKGK